MTGCPRPIHGLGSGVGGWDGVVGTMRRLLLPCDRGDSGLTVAPAPAVAGGATTLPASSFPGLVRLVLSLSESVEQRGAVLGSLLMTAAVTGARGVPAPALLVLAAAAVAYSSSVPAPSVSTPGTASVTASPGRCERAKESSRPERRRRWSSGRERFRSGGKRGKGRSPSPARSARSACASASSDSEWGGGGGGASALPPPPTSRLGAGGGRCGSDRSASGCARSSLPGPSGLCAGGAER